MVVLILCGWAEHDSNRILTDSSNHAEGRSPHLAKKRIKYCLPGISASFFRLFLSTENPSVSCISLSRRDIRDLSKVLTSHHL